MSFNIRYGLADDGENHWDRRKALVIDRIRTFQPNLLGLQECLDGAQAAYVKQHLPDYQFVGVRRGGSGDSAAEMAPVLYQRSAFVEVERGHFWLSETPDVSGSKSWGSVFARTATWVKLRHLDSDRIIVFLNTHFDYGTEATIEESAKLLQQWATASDEKHPLVVTGDFNAGKDTPAYHCLTQGGVLHDVYRTVEPAGGNEGTYHGYGQPEVPAIDWILASEHFEAVTAEIDSYREGSLFPSDHFPLTAVLGLKNHRLQAT